jgi:glycosyltransferase involved in cell wall biosynthesis
MPDAESTLPLLSLIVATVDRVEELRHCLESLRTCTFRSFEVIVADQNEDLRVQEVIESVGSSFPVVWLRMDHRHATDARNAGAARARGQWLGFPDDDCCFLPDTLERIRAHAVGDGIDVLTGMTRDREGHPSVLPWHPAEARITRHVLRRSVAESTLYLRREIFFAVGGFDPAFGPGSLFGAEEGVDLVRRIWREMPSARMKYYPEICFVHDNGSSQVDDRALRKIRVYSRARGACFARHWQSASPRRFVNDIGRHVAGSLIFRGSRRRSRIISLVGYVEGFIAYRQWERQKQRVGGP